MRFKIIDDTGRAFADFDLPYVAPTPPKPERAEVEVVFGISAIPWGTSAPTDSGNAIACARAKFGFSRDGKVWFGDERARELASMLRRIAARVEPTTIVDYQYAERVREAAERLAGPEE